MKYIHTPFYRKDRNLWVIRHRDKNGKLLPDKYAKTEEEAKQIYDDLHEDLAQTGAPETNIPAAKSKKLAALETTAADLDIDFEELLRKEIERRSGAKGAKTIAEACLKFLETDFKKIYEPSTQTTNRSTLNKFIKAYGNLSLINFTLDEVYDYQDSLLDEISVGSVRREMYALKRFFAWCKKRKRRYITKNPFDEWEVEELDEDEDNDEPPSIFSPDEWRKIIEKAIAIDPHFIPALILPARTGMRTCELRKIHPSSIDVANETITIESHVAKKPPKGRRQGRIVENLPNPDLWIWLKPFTAPDGKLQHLDRRNYHRRKKKIVAEALGIDQRELKLKNEGRHSFASYQYVQIKDPGKVKHWLGHRNEKVLWQHYVNMGLTESDAESYFNVLPPENFDGLLRNWTKERARKNCEYPADEELHALVWKTPVIHVATELGISDNAVRKHCKKRRIPMPPRGYWAKAKAKR